MDVMSAPLFFMYYILLNRQPYLYIFDAAVYLILMPWSCRLPSLLTLPKVRTAPPQQHPQGPPWVNHSSGSFEKSKKRKNAEINVPKFSLRSLNIKWLETNLDFFVPSLLWATKIPKKKLCDELCSFNALASMFLVMCSYCELGRGGRRKCWPEFWSFQVREQS